MAEITRHHSASLGGLNSQIADIASGQASLLFATALWPPWRAEPSNSSHITRAAASNFKLLPLAKYVGPPRRQMLYRRYDGSSHQYIFASVASITYDDAGSKRLIGDDMLLCHIALLAYAIKRR